LETERVRNAKRGMRNAEQVVWSSIPDTTFRERPVFALFRVPRSAFRAVVGLGVAEW